MPSWVAAHNTAAAAMTFGRKRNAIVVGNLKVRLNELPLDASEASEPSSGRQTHVSLTNNHAALATSSASLRPRSAAN